jgi:hypothetical protein
LHFNERLQVSHSARAVANQFDLQAALLDFGNDGRRHSFRT